MTIQNSKFKNHSTFYILHSTFNHGFTLIEVLIASAIFVVIVGLSTAIFSSSSNFQSRTKVIRDSSQTARYAVEAIARDIRLASGFTDINEIYHPPFSINSTSDITINYVEPESKNHTSWQYQLADGFYGNSSKKTLTVTKYENGNVGAVEPVTSDTVNVKNLNFSGQSSWEIGATVQPYLTIEMTIENQIGVKKIETFTQTIRTTVTTRNYPGFE